MARGIDPIPILVGAAAGAVDGVVVHLDQKAARYACATHELKLGSRVLTWGAGLVAGAVGADPDIAQGLAVAGAFLTGSRVALGIARGGQVSRGAGCG
jgi:hypothetical protein